MTDEQWNEVLQILYGCYEKMDRNPVKAQAWRLVFDRYGHRLVKQAIIEHYTKSGEKFYPVPSEIKKRLVVIQRRNDYKAMLEKARNNTPVGLPPPVKSLVDIAAKPKRNALCAPECLKVQKPTREQLAEARRVKTALIRELKGELKGEGDVYE